MVEKSKVAEAKPVKKSSKKLVLIIVAALLLLVNAVVGGFWLHFNDRAMPNVVVASVKVGGLKRSEVRKIVEDQTAKVVLSLQQNGKEITATPKDVGVTYDIDKTVDAVMAVGRDVTQLPTIIKGQTIPLAYTSDLGVAIEFARQNFPDIVINPKDAELVFNPETKIFDIKAGVDGQGFDVAAFAGKIEQLALAPKQVTLPVTTTPVKPAIQPEGLQPVQKDINERLAISIKFLHQGRLMYFVDPEDIASLVSFTPNVTDKTAKPEYDIGKIQQFLRQKVSPSIASGPVDRKVIRNPSSGEEIVIQAGREGKQLSDIEGLAKEVLTALQNKQSIEKEVAVTTAPFKTVTLAGGGDKWVEVDLSEQRVTLYTGSTSIASFTVSTGVAAWPTVTGEFAIWYKTPNQVMTGGSRASGDYYYLPNVTWVSYFYKDYGFHTAYWHNNFGTPMSHGCVNMRQADAKVLYDFAPVGTKVIVHG